MTKEMRRTILKIRILMRIKKKKTYAYAILKEFGVGSFASFIGPKIKNDIYNSLSALEKSGYIKHSVKVTSTGIKKYYSITSKGIKASKTLKKAFEESMEYAMKILG
jgi:DNA-binding PadR family transcriptional regulator